MFIILTNPNPINMKTSIFLLFALIFSSSVSGPGRAWQLVSYKEIDGFQEYSFSLDNSDGIYLVSITDGLNKQSGKIIFRK
jgi:hypothetical protein